MILTLDNAIRFLQHSSIVLRPQTHFNRFVRPDGLSVLPGIPIGKESMGLAERLASGRAMLLGRPRLGD